MTSFSLVAQMIGYQKLLEIKFQTKFFIDNNNDLHGKEYAGVKVISLSKFEKIRNVIL